MESKLNTYPAPTEMYLQMLMHCKNTKKRCLTVAIWIKNSGYCLEIMQVDD